MWRFSIGGVDEERTSTTSLHSDSIEWLVLNPDPYQDGLLTVTCTVVDALDRSNSRVQTYTIPAITEPNTAPEVSYLGKYVPGEGEPVIAMPGITVVTVRVQDAQGGNLTVWHNPDVDGATVPEDA